MQKTSPLRAAVWMAGALVSFTVMAVAVRAIALELDTLQLMVYRSLFAVPVIVAVILLSGGGRQTFVTRRPLLHLARNMSHFVGQFGWFFGVASLIPLSQVFALEFTTPLWVAVLAPLVLGERLTAMRIVAALLGFVGVLVVLKFELQAIDAGSLAVLVAAVGFAGAFMGTKRLSATDRPLTILFYMAIIQAPVSLLLAAFATELVLPTPLTALLVLVVTACGLTAHFCIANAVRHADAIVVTPMDFMRLPVITAVAALLYDEPLELWVLGGAVLILAGIYANLMAETRSPPIPVRTLGSGRPPPG